MRSVVKIWYCIHTRDNYRCMTVMKDNREIFVSVFDLFKVGIGPSSSHTVGPMVAANRFLLNLESRGLLQALHRITVDLFGSLALTGKGHCTDIAILLGLSGEAPDKVDPDRVPRIITTIRETGTIRLFGRVALPFTERNDLMFNFDKVLSRHSNGLQFSAYGAESTLVLRNTYYSIGGGFVIGDDGIDQSGAAHNLELPYPFYSAAELLELGERTGFSIAKIALENEKVRRSEQEVRNGLQSIWETMQSCIDRGCRETGNLPGPLGVKRRAGHLYQALQQRVEASHGDKLAAMDWVNVFALAVNEENAAGGRVVTAPTNGAAGIIPAVLAYYVRFVPGAGADGIVTFLLTAGAIGTLYKRNASISAAEVGCQGEVGVACSMAAAGLAAVLGASNEQIENAAEIAMEHNLGLTCDPVGGLVQIPCIERNTMGAVKAINAARLALSGNGQHLVSLDKVIETMRQTGLDMQEKYKETSKGGLAVNVAIC